MVHPTAPTPPNDGVSLTGPRRTALTHLLVLARSTPVHSLAHLNLRPLLSVSPRRSHPQHAQPSGFWSCFQMCNTMVTTSRQLQGGNLITAQPKWWNSVSIQPKPHAHTYTHMHAHARTHTPAHTQNKTKNSANFFLQLVWYLVFYYVILVCVEFALPWFCFNYSGAETRSHL